MDKIYDAINQSENFLILDETTGLPKTGLAYNSVGAGAFYLRTRSVPIPITLSALGSSTAAYAPGGFVEIDASLCPGHYRLDVPDAAYATGSANVIIGLKFTGAIVTPLNFRLVAAGFTLSQSDLNAIAVNIFKYNLATISGEPAKCLLNAVRKDINKTEIVGTTMIVFKEDGLNTAYTFQVATSANVTPITGLTPN